MQLEPFQTTIDDGIPLVEVTFAVVDLETTGGSPATDAITEVGAVCYRGGERLGTFGSLVDPRQPIPPYVARLTGISDAMVSGAPPIEHVLPSLLEFLRGAVFVAHNASFDFGFVNANLRRLEYPPLEGPPVCTAKLARRVVWPDVPNVRLQTLARYFRTRVQPSHRALADAEATGEVFAGLLDAGAHLGILTLGDLREACSARGRPNFGKIALAASLPRSPGVYLFEDRSGRVLYVGKAKDLRARVKSYFYGDERKKVQDLLASVAAVRAVPTDGELEALALEARLIARHEPRYNAHGKRWRRYAYLKVDLRDAWPRIKVVRSASQGNDAVYLGPFGSSSRARLAKEALEHVAPIRRCTTSMGARTRFAPCALADMGRCAAPCDDRTTPEAYARLVRELLASIAAPGSMLDDLETRMSVLAEQERYEEAALVRDRLRALADALARARTDAWLVAGSIVLRGADGVRMELRDGALVRAGEAAPEPIGWPVPRERADELSAVRSWIRRHPVRVERCSVPPSEPVNGGAALAQILDAVRRAEEPADRRDRMRRRPGTGGAREPG
jgi:DNA polymerase III subunit epsilon